MAGAVVLRVLQAEGWGGVWNRVLDRLAEARRDRGFVRVETLPAGVGSPVLIVSGCRPALRLGGVQAQLLARLEASRGPWALLYPEAQGYRLEVSAGKGRFAMGLPAPGLKAEALRDPDFERAVKWALRQTGARAVQIEGTAGLPLQSLLQLEGRLILALHDFSLHCLRPHLLEKPGLAYCNRCLDLERCRRCLAQDWVLEADWLARRRGIAGELLQRADAVVFPSDFLRRDLLEIFQQDAAKWHLIEPASFLESEHEGANGALPSTPPGDTYPGTLGFGRFALFWRGVAADRRHIACVGWIHAHKGASVLEDLVLRMPKSAGLRFTVLGGGDAQCLLRLRTLGLRVLGYYRRGSLGRRLQRDGVGLVLLPSIVPESYSLTLSECWAAGIPVLAFDQGAIGDRIRAHGGGILIPSEAGVEGLAEALSGWLAGQLVPRPSAGWSDARTAAEAWATLYRKLGLESSGSS